MAKDTTLYDRLKVAVDADSAEIARAYRRLALGCHPDRHPERADEFKQLTAAYEVLSDASTRSIYDATGSVPGAGEAEVSPQERSAVLERQVREFFSTYADSDEERADVAAAYHKHDGNFSHMIKKALLFDNGVDGEVGRLLARTRELMAQKKLTATEAWARTTTSAAIEKLEKTMRRERREAEEALKEMGLEHAGEGGGMGDLQALIQQRQKASFQSMMSSLEEKYVARPTSGSKRSGEGRSSNTAKSKKMRT